MLAISVHMNMLAVNKNLANKRRGQWTIGIGRGVMTAVLERRAVIGCAAAVLERAGAP
jgi:hypothetical protein